jgi:hypothetical protein
MMSCLMLLVCSPSGGFGSKVKAVGQIFFGHVFVTINQLSNCLLGVLDFRSLDFVICHPIILQWCPPVVNSPGIHVPGLT